MKTLFFSLLLFLSAYAVYAGPVTGSASIGNQFGQPSQETMQQLRNEAAVAFRNELNMWLRREMRIDIDTMNTAKKFALEKLSKRCFEAAAEKTVTKGRVWTLSLEVSESAVKNAWNAHNSHYNSQASSHFQNVQDGEPVNALPHMIKALGAAVMVIEPAGAGGANLETIHTAAQALFNRVRVKTVGTVIDGRPGILPQNAPSIEVTIDENPVPDFHFIAVAQNGRVLARMSTDNRGQVPMKNQKVPFVHNGSMLSMSPDARVYLQSENFIRYKDLGLRLTSAHEPTFIFKVPALTYTLDYKASTQEADISLPADFTNDAHIRKYLREFSGLVPAASGATPDLTIRINAVISKNTHDDTEEDGILMQSRAEFRGTNIEQRGEHNFESRYKFGMIIPMGNYFWEASNALKDLIANTLSQPFK